MLVIDDLSGFRTLIAVLICIKDYTSLRPT